MNEIERVDTLTHIDYNLSDSARSRIARSTPEGTRRAYEGDWRRYLTWCEHTNRTPLPATPATLAEYADHLVTAGRAPSTIERALAAISAAHQAAGATRPNLTLARAVLRTARRDRAHTATTPMVRKAAPITVDVLRALVATCDTATPAGIRDRALLVLGFALGSRRSELAALNLADIAEDRDGLLVTIRTSKTDRDSAGRRVALPYGSSPDTCPVRVVQAWRRLLADHGHLVGPLFVRIDRHGVLCRTATGRGSRDGRLSGQAVALIVQRAARAAGLDPDAAWSGHSLRRGFATAAYAAGADPLRIARHGGWRDGSTTLLGYIEEVDRWSANPLVGVGL